MASPMSHSARTELFLIKPGALRHPVAITCRFAWVPDSLSDVCAISGLRIKEFGGHDKDGVSGNISHVGLLRRHEAQTTASAKRGRNG
jgi:hypothetical protein